jgi:hypothetical protein
VTVLLGAPPEGVVLDVEEQRALEVLAGYGLVPPLRLVCDSSSDVVTSVSAEAESDGTTGISSSEAAEGVAPDITRPARRAALPPRAVSG